MKLIVESTKFHFFLLFLKFSVTERRGNARIETLRFLRFDPVLALHAAIRLSIEST